MPNRLSHETSPYLLQHAGNPVDWYPWGREAFAKAREENKPVFLSVGYSACHWCHLMEHESFEDEATAALMNRHFVSVKVDREERPDIDSIYMDAVQALTGHGGWPMSVFLTPDGAPFFGGTYFPKERGHGLPAFADVLARIAELWEQSPGELVGIGSRLALGLRDDADALVTGEASALNSDVPDKASRTLARFFDREYGGFGGAPKFPQPVTIEFALRRYLATRDETMLTLVTATLDAMARGGIYDQLGGGFHRYSTDGRWLVPHFEKMLYDNAQIARVYLHAWQVTGSDIYRRVATETLDYLAREMLDESGGFYSAQDADSEGEEGRFFVWTPDEIRSALADAAPEVQADGDLFMTAHGVTPAGNFEGRSILHVVRPVAELASEWGIDEADLSARLARVHAALFEAREAHVRPGLDDKVLASWNGLALAAFAEAARVLRRGDYLAIATRNAEFLLARLRTSEGRMLHTWKAGEAKINGFLEDYAFCADGLVELYQSTFEPRWFVAARELGDAILEHFSDPAGGFFDTSDDHEELLLRPRSIQDGVVPSGGSMAASVLLRLAEYTGDIGYSRAAEAAIAQVQETAAQSPIAFANWLAALDFALAPPTEVAIVGEGTDEMLEVVRRAYRPNVVVAASSGGAASGAAGGATGDGADTAAGIALLESREAVDGKPTAYVCRRFTCEQPVTSAAELEQLLGGTGSE